MGIAVIVLVKIALAKVVLVDLIKYN